MHARRERCILALKFNVDFLLSFSGLCLRDATKILQALGSRFLTGVRWMFSVGFLLEAGFFDVREV